MNIPNFIKEHAKTVVAFVATFIGNAIVSLIKGETAWPQTKDEWLQYALTSVGAAFSVWLARNKITQKQINADPNVVGTVYPEPVQTSTAPLPPSATVDGAPPWVS